MLDLQTNLLKRYPSRKSKAAKSRTMRMKPVLSKKLARVAASFLGSEPLQEQELFKYQIDWNEL